jgi:hypothetical protein
METGVSQRSPDSPPTPQGRRDSYLMRSVNTNLRQRCEAQQVDEPIAFFCECASHSCYSPIWKSATAFDATMAKEPGWLLHEKHEPSELWHRRESLPARRSLRAGTAVGGHQIDPAEMISSEEAHAQTRHPRLPLLGVLRTTRDSHRGRLKATHA